MSAPRAFVSGLDPADGIFRNHRSRRHPPVALGPELSARPHRPDRRCVAGGAVRQPCGLSRRARLRADARIARALSSPERHRRAEDAKGAAAAGGDCRPGAGRAGRPETEGRARSRLRGAAGAAVPPDQGGRRGARRPRDRRALCRRHRRRYAAARLLHDQIGHQRADRHPDGAGHRHAVDAGADSGMARANRSAPRDRGRAFDADDHGTGAG